MKKIKIKVTRGLIADIEGLPDGYTVEVWDYDIDDKEEQEITEDGNGDCAYVYEW